MARARRASSGKGSPCRRAASNSPHNTARVDPAPMAVHTHSPGRRAGATGPTMGRRSMSGTAHAGPGVQAARCAAFKRWTQRWGGGGHQGLQALPQLVAWAAVCSSGAGQLSTSRSKVEPMCQAMPFSCGTCATSAAVAVDGEWRQPGGARRLRPPGQLAAHGLQGQTQGLAPWPAGCCRRGLWPVLPPRLQPGAGLHHRAPARCRGRCVAVWPRGCGPAR